MTGFWLSLAVFALLLWQLLALLRGLPGVRQLADLPADGGDDLPQVSVVVSALNEEATVEPALRSLLALEAPMLEVIAIDDRSTDGTGAILDRLAAGEPRLRVHHVRELPPGWLGKNHALHLGSQLAAGDALLFTDADVHFEARALQRAVRYAVQHRLDHLVVLAELTVREPLLASLLLNFYAFYFAALPPWKVASSRKAYAGMGAFNLVRAAAYREAGGHEALRMEVIDDMLLGKRMKRHGFRQDVLLGLGTVRLEWYRSTGELMRGLEKNSFAAVEYSVPRAVAGSVAVLLGRVWPLAGLVLTSGAAWWFNLGSVAVGLAIHARLLCMTRWPWRSLAWWPLSAVVMLFILWRSLVLTLRRGGIVWRGTLYPLDDLRRGHVN